VVNQKQTKSHDSMRRPTEGCAIRARMLQNITAAKVRRGAQFCSQSVFINKLIRPLGQNWHV